MFFVKFTVDLPNGVGLLNKTYLSQREIYDNRILIQRFLDLIRKLIQYHKRLKGKMVPMVLRTFLERYAETTLFGDDPRVKINRFFNLEKKLWLSILCSEDHSWAELSITASLKLNAAVPWADPAIFVRLQNLIMWHFRNRSIYNDLCNQEKIYKLMLVFVRDQ